MSAVPCRVADVCFNVSYGARPDRLPEPCPSRIDLLGTRVQTSEGMTQLEASLARLLAAQRVQWKTPQQNIVQLLPASA